MKRLILHYSPHTDEMVVLALRRLFPKEANARFPGFTRAEVEQWCFGQAFDLPADDSFVGLGIGRKTLDEHGRSNEEETCAAELFAQEIGILLSDEEINKLPEKQRAKYKAVRLMIEVVRDEDRGGAGAGDSIHNMLKLINRMKDLPSFAEIMVWCTWAYIAEFRALKKCIEERGGSKKKIVTVSRAFNNISEIYSKRNAEKWLALAKEAREEARQVTDRTFSMIVADREKPQPKYWSSISSWQQDANGEMHEVMYTMVAIELPDFNYFVPTAMRRLRNSMPDIMVIWQPNGHVAIMSEKDDIDFTEVARALRIKLLHSIEGHNGGFTVAKLSVKGEVLGWPKASPYLYLHVKTPANQAYIGAETAPSVPGSPVPLERILWMIRTIFSGTFYVKYREKCQSGYCVGRECPFFYLHMKRCLRVQQRSADTVMVR